MRLILLDLEVMQNTPREVDVMSKTRPRKLEKKRFIARIIRRIKT